MASPRRSYETFVWRLDDPETTLDENQVPHDDSKPTSTALVKLPASGTNRRERTTSSASDESNRMLSPCQGLNRIKSIELEMTQLRMRFAENYYPSNLDPERISTDFQFNLPVRAFYTSRSSLTRAGGQNSLLSDLALSLAVDAISLAGMASSTDNKPALLHAFRLSQAALMAHREAVSESIINSGQNQESVNDSKLLLGAQALHFCQQFSALSEAQGGGSIIHIQGLGDMITARGLENMARDDDYKAFLRYYQQYATRFGFMLRRPIHRKLEEAWHNHDMQFEGPYSQIMYHSIRIPAMLEDADRVCERLATLQRQGIQSRQGSDPAAVASAIALIQRLQEHELALQTWYTENHSANEAPYHPVACSEVQLLHEMPESLQDLFPCGFRFTSFYSAVCHSRFWVDLLETRAAIAMLLHSTRTSDITPNVRNVTECADELCQTIMFFMETENGAVGFMPIGGSLKSIYRWYKLIGDEKKMDWCRHVGRIIEAKGICPPDLNSP